MNEKVVKMQDIANKLNVSTVTISKALNDKGGVSLALQHKIRSTAEEMGYKINRAARTMKTGLKYNVGIVIPSYFFNKTNSFYLYYLRCLLDELNQHDYYGMVQFIDQEQRLNLILPKFCEERLVDGIIFLGQISREYILAVKTIGLPIVLSDFYDSIDGIEAVAANNVNNSYELTNYLFSLGHQEIGFVGNITATSSIQDRYLGYTKALIEHGYDINPSWVINDREEEQQVFSVFSLPDKMPTAFICNSDEVAYKFILCLKQHKISVPKQCSVAAFDNTIYAQVSDPTITTVEVDVENMAKLTVGKMLDKINDKLKGYGNIFLDGKIIQGNSTKAEK